MDQMRNLLMGLMEAPAPREDATLDAAEALDDAASTHLTQSLRMHAGSVLNTWAETEDDDLDDGETLSDRLFALLVAAVDEDGDEELDEAEQEVMEAALEAAEDYLAAQGVDEDDIDALFDEWSEDAAVRVRDALAASLPDGDEADEGVSGFAFGATESVFDAARYRDMVSFKQGKKSTRRRRVSGRAKKMSAKQRVALKKARRKSHTSQAKRWRKVSMRKRQKAGYGGRSKRA